MKKYYFTFISDAIKHVRHGVAKRSFDEKLIINTCMKVTLYAERKRV